MIPPAKSTAFLWIVQIIHKFFIKTHTILDSPAPPGVSLSYPPYWIREVEALTLTVN